MMSAAVDLPVGAGDTSTFTLIRDGDLADIYAGAVASGNFVTSVGISDAQPLVIATPGPTAAVGVDPSGGNPLPGGLTVAAGSIIVNQDLGEAGAPVNLSVDAGASVNFSASQHLNGLTIQAGATVDMTAGSGQGLYTTSVSVAGTLDLGDSGLVATAPTAADLSTIQAQLGDGETLLNTTLEEDPGIYASTQDTLDVEDDGELTADPISTTPPTTQPTTAPSAPNTFEATPAKGATTATVSGTVTHNGKVVEPGTILVNVGVDNGPVDWPVGRTGSNPTVSPKSNRIADANGNITIQIDLNGASTGTYIFKLRTTDLNKDDIMVTIHVQ